MTRVEAIFFLVFVNVMNAIIRIIVLLFLHLHLFVIIFDKLKTGPRPTLFSKTSTMLPLFIDGKYR